MLWLHYFGISDHCPRRNYELACPLLLQTLGPTFLPLLRFLNPNRTWNDRGQQEGQRWPKSYCLQKPLPLRPRCPGLRVAGLPEAPRPRAAAPPSQYSVTVTERRPAAPGLRHLLFQGFFRDSIRKLRYHLLLPLFPRTAGARLSWPFPIHLLLSYRPTPL